MKKGELPRLKCFHNGIILIVISFKNCTAKILNKNKLSNVLFNKINLLTLSLLINHVKHNIMKKILGLDLGSASIGWALITEDKENGITNYEISGIGSRIIPYEGTEGKDFAKGTGESRNSSRTKARRARKGYDRYQLRRRFLVETLIKNKMFPDDSLKNLPKMQLWELRNKAVDSPISLIELGRLFLWLNQKRGYKSSRSDANLDKKDTEYVATVKSRHEKIKELNLTIGQYF